MRPTTREGWISPPDGANLRALGALQATAPAGPRGRVAGLDVEEGRRPFWLDAFDALAVASLVALLAVAATRVVRVLIADPGAAWVLLPALLAAVLAADLVSGVVHWVCDRFFSETTPLVGRMLIHPFREHHRDPHAITRHGFFELCGNNALAVLAPVLLLVWSGPPSPRAGAIATHVFVVLFASAVFATNQVHEWAHAERRPRAVRVLQRARLVLSPEAHERHHRDDFSRAYCVTTGWLNPMLDALRVLPRAERLIRTTRATLRRRALARRARGAPAAHGARGALRSRRSSSRTRSSPASC